jgi:hypothetical protein
MLQGTNAFTTIPLSHKKKRKKEKEKKTDFQWCSQIPTAQEIKDVRKLSNKGRK